MKFYLKNTIKLGILIFVISLLFWNCEKETVLPEEINQVEDQDSTFSLKHYSREHIKKNTKLVSKLKEFNDKLAKNKSAKYSGKNIYNEKYDFTIYTDSATYIKHGDYHSYTFPILQGADEKITNVLFELNDQGEYDAFLVNYDYSANELKNKDFNSLSMKTSMKPIDLDFNSLFARTMSAYICIYSYEYISDGELRGAGNEVYEWVLTASYCENVYYEVNDSKVYSNGGNNATVTVSGTTPRGSGSTTSPTPSPSPFDAEELMEISVVKSELGLNLPERLWIDKWANGHIAFKIYNFCTAEMWSQEAKAFGNEIVDSGVDNTLVTAFPFVKYPPNSNYAIQYPKLTEYLKIQLPTIKNNQFIINKIVQYGDLGQSEVKKHLEWGNGPIIEVVQLNNFCTGCDSDTYGLFKGNNPNTLYIDLDLVNDLENSTTGSQLANSFAFLIGVTILHEYVHYSEYTDGAWNNPESGILFENDVYGQSVWRENANIILKNN
ncbi:hypothetical protein [Confluentibacter sediminis]|uniref:hypothetical protein n=1 Tax=Confluentibacter sediminis TaxID=2219045 RepID=UPI0013A6B58D|nr:hypothetical protein [Confluentibacter sediminis]